MNVTHLHTAMALLELQGLRLLTDPVLDPAGREYAFGFGTRSRKQTETVLPPGGLGALDAVLLSHDQHGDNLDDAGRALLPTVKQVFTTRAAARRLGGNAVGLEPWESVTLGSVRVTATPARHGPPGSLPIVGPVIGFVLEWPGQVHGAVYISGDTVRFKGVDEVARRFKVGTALLHLGCVRFPISGPLRYTFSAQEAAQVAQALGARTVIPLHYEGWSHFSQGRADAEAAFSALGPRVRWLTPGVSTAVEV
jgi:L-ascorbate metabolism protein UlaG (beta-lactamase superfamily)